MARPPNKSGLGPQNDLGGVDFASLGERAQRRTVQNRTDTIRVGNLNADIDLIDNALELVAPGSAEEAAFSSRKTKLQNRLAAISSRSDVRFAAQVERVSDLTQNQIAGAYSSSSVNGQAMQISRTSAAQNASMSMSGADWGALEQKKNQAQNVITTLGQQAAVLGANLYDKDTGEQDPNKVARLKQLEARKNVAVNAMGITEGAMRSQRALGLDPQSRDIDLLKAGDRAKGMLNSASIAEEMRSGGGINISRGGNAVSVSSGNIQSALDTEARTLVDALKRLQSGMDPLSDAFKKLKVEAEEAGSNIEKLKEAEKSGGGGGMRGSVVASALASGFYAAAGATQEIFVNQRLQQRSNIAGLANIENQKYDMYKAASGGDIASQMLLTQFGDAEAFGGSVAKGQIAVQGLQGVGALAQIGAGGLQALEGTGQNLNPISHVLGTDTAATNTAITGMVNMAGGTAQAGITAMDLWRRTSETSTRIQGIQADMEARKAVIRIPAEQLQGFRDYGVGLSVAAQGLGSAGAGFVNRSLEFAKGGFGGNPNESVLSNARISPEQMAKMSQMGVSMMGSTFNENQILTARGLERSGMGNMQQNMERMATLATAGGNDPGASLVGVLEVAVSRGMDSSKAIDSLVEHSATMAASSIGRAMGMDTTAAAAGMLATMVGPDANKEAALARAASLQETIRDISTNTDVSFAGMMATSRISKTTGLGGVEAISAQKMDIQTLQAMKKMTPTQRAEAFLERGINVSPEGSGKMLDTLLFDKSITLGEGKGIGFVVGTPAEAIAKRIRDSGGKLTYADLSHREKEILGKAAGAGNTGFATGQEMFNAMKTPFAEDTDPNTKKRLGNDLAGKGGSPEQRALDEMRTLGFKQLSQAAVEATKGFNKATDAVAALSALSKEFEAMGKKGIEGKFSGAAADSAASFDASTTKFEKSVGHFSTAITNWAKKAGLDAEDSPHKEVKQRKTPTHKMSAGQQG